MDKVPVSATLDWRETSPAFKLGAYASHRAYQPRKFLHTPLFVVAKACAVFGCILFSSLFWLYRHSLWPSFLTPSLQLASISLPAVSDQLDALGGHATPVMATYSCEWPCQPAFYC